MSNVVDEQILKMRFDGSQFNSNIQTSLKVLAELRDSLNFEGVGKGLSSLGSILGSAGDTLGGVADAAETISKRLSTAGIAAATFTQNVVTDIYKTAKSILSNNIISQAINQMKTGGMARAENLENAKFQLQGLKVAWEEVEPYISKAVDGTAYGLDAAAKVASQLVASNVALGDEMQNALSGISGVAAMTNSSYEDIGHIFTTIAGQGKVMTEQLNQFAGRGLNVAAELAKVYGVDEAALREMVTKGEVDFKTFSQAMNEAFGEQATRANETYTGSLSNMKAALSRIGAEFLIPYRNNMRDLFNSIRPKINDLKKLLMPFIERFVKAENAFFKFITKAIDGIDLSPLSKIVDFAIKIVDVLSALGNKGMEIWKKVFPDSVVTKIAGVAFEVNKAGVLFDKLSPKVNEAIDAFKKFFEPVAAVAEPLEKVNDNIEEMAQRVIGGEFGSGEERRKALEDLGYSYEMVQNKVNELCGSSFRYEVSAEDQAKAAGKVAEANENSAKSYSIIDTVVKHAEPIMTGFASALSMVVEAASAIVVGLSPLESVIVNLASGLLTLIEYVGRMFTDFRNATQEAGTFVTLGGKLHAVLSAVADRLNPVADALEKFGIGIIQLITKIGLLFINYDRFKQKNDKLSHAIGYIIDIFKQFNAIVGEVVDWFTSLIDRIKQTPAFSRFVGTVKALGSALKDLGINMFLALLQKISTALGNFKMPEIDKNKVVYKVLTALTSLRRIIEGVTEKVRYLADTFDKHGFKAIGILIGGVKENFERWNKSVVDGEGPMKKFVSLFNMAKDTVVKFIDKLSPKNSKVTRTFVQGIQSVIDGVEKFVAVFKRDPGLAIKVWLNKIRLAFLGKFKEIQELVSPFTDVIKAMFQNLVDVLERIGVLPALRKILEPITTEIEKFVAVFKRNPSLAIKAWINKIKLAIIGQGSVLKAKAADLFAKIKQVFTDFATDFKADPATAFKNLFAKLKEAVSNFKIDDIVKILKEKFFGIFKLSASSIRGDASGASGFMETITEIITAIKENFVEGFKGINLQSVSNVIAAFPNWFKALSVGLLAFQGSRIFKNVAKVPKELANLIGSFTKDFIPEVTKIPAAIATGIKDFFTISTSIKDFFKQLTSTIGELGKGLTDTMKSYRKHLAVKNVLYIAASVALITVAIIALAQFPPDKLLVAGLVVAGTMIVLRAVCDGMAGLDAKPMIAFGIVVGALAAALVALSFVSWDTIGDSLFKFAAVATVMLGVVYVLQSIVKSGVLTQDFGVGILGFTAGVAILAFAFEKLFDTIGSKKGIGANIGAFVGALVAITVMIGELAVLTRITNGADLAGTAASLIGYAAAIEIMAIAFNTLMLGMTSFGKWAGAMAALIAIVAALGALTVVTSATDLTVTAGAMIGFAIALQMLMGVFATASLFSPETIIKAIGIMVGVAGALWVLGKAMQALVPPIATLLVVGGALAGLLAIFAMHWDVLSAGFSKMWKSLNSENGIITKISKWITNLVSGVKNFFAQAGQNLSKLSFVKWLLDLPKTAKNAKGSIINVGDAFKGLLDKFTGWASKFGPVKAAFEFLGGLKDKIGGGLSAIGDFFSGIFGNLSGGGGILDLLTSIPDKIQGVKDSLYETFVKGTFVEDIFNGVSGFTSGITSKLSDMFGGLTEGGVEGLQNLIKGFTEDPLGAISGALDNLKKIWLGDGEGDTGVWGMVKSFFEPGVSAIKNLFSGFGENIANFFKDPLGNLKTWWLGEEGTDNNGVWGMISGFFSAGVGALGKIKDGFLDGITSFFNDPLDTLKTWWLGDEDGKEGVWGRITGFFDAGKAALTKIKDGFVEGIESFFSNPIETLKTWWLGEEGKGDGVWGTISGFVEVGKGALTKLKDGFVNGIESFFKDPLDTLKEWWLGSEESGGGVWDTISGFVDAGKGALTKLKDGFLEDISTFFKDPLDTLKTWWLGSKDGDGGVWGIVSGFAWAGANALTGLIGGFTGAISAFVADPIKTIKDWWLGSKDGNGGVWGMVSGFAEAGTTALSNLVADWTADEDGIVGKAVGAVKGLFFGSDGKGGIKGWADSILDAGKEMAENLVADWTDDENSPIGKAFNAVKGLFFGGNGEGGVFGWASDMLKAGSDMASNLISDFKTGPGSTIKSAFDSVHDLFFGESDKGGVFSWASNILKAGSDMASNLISDWNDSSDGPIKSAFNTVKGIFFGESDKGGVFGWASNMLSAGKDMIQNLSDGVNDTEKLKAITNAVSGLGRTIMYGNGDATNPGSLSIMGAFNAVKDGAGSLLDAIKDNFNDPSKQSLLKSAANGIGNIISNAFEGVGSFFQKGLDFFDQLINGFSEESTSTVGSNGMGGGGRKFDEAINNMVLAVGAFSDQFGTCGADFFKAVSDAFGGNTEATQLALATVGVGIMKLVNKVGEYRNTFTTEGSLLYKAIGEGFKDEQTLNIVKENIGIGVSKGVHQAVKQWYTNLESDGKKLAESLKDGFVGYKDRLKTFVGQVIFQQVTKINTYLKDFKSSGEKLITNLKDGILAKKGEAVTEAGNVASDGHMKIREYEELYQRDGNRLIEYLKLGFSELVDQFTTAVGHVMFAGANQYFEYIDNYSTAGSNLVAAMADGVHRSYSSYAYGDFVSAIDSIMNQGYNVTTQYVSWFFTAGQNIVTGLANGVYYNAYTAINAIQEVAYNMFNRMCNILNINSPSKEFEKVGRYIDEGLAVGLDKNTYQVTTSVDTVGKTALLAMGKAIASMSELVDENMNTKPVIRPIMDMDDVVTGFKEIGAMANNQDYQLGLAAAGIFQEDVLTRVNPNQNQLVETINTLRSDIARLSDAVYGATDSDSMMQATFPIYLDGEEIGSRTADVAIRRINHIQANKLRMAGR